MVLRKHEIERALHEEHRDIAAGRLKEDNPLDTSKEFEQLCQACRRGDLKSCQEKIQEGVNINARDRFDYTPLILASLCGHYEVAQLLLESGALCERDTFQGERCLYNALNDRIRNLLLSYDYSKTRDPLQPLAGHITSLLTRDVPDTSDISITTDIKTFHLHKFLLAARSPYFANKLSQAPDTATWKVPSSMPAQSLEVTIRALYFEEINTEFTADEEDQAILEGIERLGRQLEIPHIFETLLESDRRITRQRRAEEVARGREQLNEWFQKSVLAHRMQVDESKVDDVKWDRQNNIFADVLLCAFEDESATNGEKGGIDKMNGRSKFDEQDGHLAPNGIPLGNSDARSRSRSRARSKATLFPVHRAMLLRSEYFNAMFSSAFREAQVLEHLPIVRVDCSPEVLEVVLRFLYTEITDFGLEVAIDVLFTADQLFIEKLKTKAAMIISTLGNGNASVVESVNARGETDVEDLLDIYDVIRAGWDTRVHRLEEFGARYIANRLERFIDDEAFMELVKESANRIRNRQETDTVELIDDIRHYLSERFRLRFEDVDYDELTEVEDEAKDQYLSNHDTLSDVETAKGASIDQDIKSGQDNTAHQDLGEDMVNRTVIRTLDGDVAGDEFTQDAVNYQILLGKIDALLDKLKLDA